MTSSTTSEHRAGIISALSAYFLWGLAPIYFKMIDQINSSEIMVHRVVWSTLLLLVIVVLSKKSSTLVSLLKQPKLILHLTVSASFLAVNNDHLLDASLGYYINPLFSVALGVVFLGERLRKKQLIAVALAVTGVLIQLIVIGSLPLISLALAGTFGIYGLLRKKMHVDSFVGLLVESAMMLPLALIYWQFFVASPTSNMFNNPTSLNTTLMFAGIVTTAPLLFFTSAAKRLTLSALGFFQYIGPSIMFLLATFHYNEPLHMAKLLTFAFIWMALVLFSFDSIKAYKEKKMLAALNSD